MSVVTEIQLEPSHPSREAVNSSAHVHQEDQFEKQFGFTLPHQLQQALSEMVVQSPTTHPPIVEHYRITSVRGSSRYVSK